MKLSKNIYLQTDNNLKDDLSLVNDDLNSNIDLPKMPKRIIAYCLFLFSFGSVFLIVGLINFFFYVLKNK